MNVLWPHFNAIAESVPTEVLTLPSGSRERNWRRRVRGLFERPSAERLQVMEDDFRLKASGFTAADRTMLDGQAHKSTIENIKEKLDSTGPNVLLAWALRHADVERLESLLPIWGLFDYKVLSIIDNLEPHHIVERVKGRFDLITSFCGDLGRDYAKATGLPTVHLPPHTDVLNYGEHGSYRPIDLFVVGRQIGRAHV